MRSKGEEMDSYECSNCAVKVKQIHNNKLMHFKNLQDVTGVPIVMARSQ